MSVCISDFLSVLAGLQKRKCPSYHMGLPGGSDGKEPAFNAGNLGSIPGLQGSPGTGTGIRLQYCCLENPMDSGVWQAIVHEVAQNWTRLKQLSTCLENPMDGGAWQVTAHQVTKSQTQLNVSDSV